MIIPSSSDPRLNTAECVSHVDDDANDSVDQMIYDRPKYGVIISTFLTFVCLFGGSLIYRFLISTHCAIDKDRLFALKFTATFVIIVDCMLLVYTCVIVMKESSLRNSTSAVIFVLVPIIYVSATIIAVPLVVLGNVLESWCLFLPLSWAVCYNCLWILLGIFAHPSWAFSVLLSICSFILLTYILAYSYSTSIRSEYSKWKIFSACMLCMCVFLSFAVFTWISVRFFLADQLISNSIQTLLFAILGTLLSVISFNPKRLLEILSISARNTPEDSNQNQETPALRLVESTN